MRAHQLLAQRLKPVFMIFRGFILGALQQPQETLISITTGHEQTSGLNQLLSHRPQVPAIFSPTTVEHFERQKTSRALQHANTSGTPVPADAMRHPGPLALLAAAHRAAVVPCPAPARPWPPGVAELGVSRPGTWVAIVAALADRLVSAARRPGRAPRGPRGQGRPRTQPAGTKQQVAPAEVIRITFNGRAGSIFSPVYAEGPGVALLMLQGTRGTH